MAHQNKYSQPKFHKDRREVKHHRECQGIIKTKVGIKLLSERD